MSRYLRVQVHDLVIGHDLLILTLTVVQLFIFCDII